MSTSYSRASIGARPVVRAGPGRCESPLSVSPSSSFIDLSRVSSPSTSARSGLGSIASSTARCKQPSSSSPANTLRGATVRGFQVNDVCKSRGQTSLCEQRPAGLLQRVLSTQQLATPDSGARQPEAEPCALPDVEERISRNLASPASIESSPQWLDAKRDAVHKVLYHPMVQRAYIIARTVHGGKARPHGNCTVMCHLEESALIVARLGLDSTAVAAALLHECLDSGELQAATLSKLTSNEICSIVSGVTKASRSVEMYGNITELHSKENTEKLLAMLVALGDARVMLIKLAGRLQQARQMLVMSADDRVTFLHVTEQLFIPIANRLGMWALKAELEDLCFEASEPGAHAELKVAVDSMLATSQSTIAEFSNDALQLLRSADIAVEDVQGRPKSLRSIRAKVCRKGDGSSRSLHDVHDVLAVRIIVPSKTQCYSAMRALAQRWPAMPGRDKNYIRQPKANGYRSLHSVLVSDSGVPIEVQIRTPAMHWNAEYGVASHWAYKEHRSAQPAADRGAEQLSAEALVAQTHAQLVAWARMVLTYGHGMGDHREPAGAPHLRSRSTLSEVTHALMASSAHSVVDNAELDHRCSSDDVALERTHSESSPASRAAPVQLRERRQSFEDFVASSVQPPALKSVLVPVTWAGGAAVCALEAVVGTSSVEKLLCSTHALTRVSSAHVLVNGVPALGPTHPLTMGDCVRIMPFRERASAALAARLYVGTMPTPLSLLRRDVMRSLSSADRTARVTVA